jgi:hypothetical protein
MPEELAEPVWYCVVVRDPITKRYQHYRCLSNMRDAEMYKLQLEQSGDRSAQGSSNVMIETLPAGELPSKVPQDRL